MPPIPGNAADDEARRQGWKIPPTIRAADGGRARGFLCLPAGGPARLYAIPEGGCGMATSR